MGHRIAIFTLALVVVGGSESFAQGTRARARRARSNGVTRSAPGFGGGQFGANGSVGVPGLIDPFQTALGSNGGMAAPGFGAAPGLAPGFGGGGFGMVAGGGANPIGVNPAAGNVNPAVGAINPLTVGAANPGNRVGVAGGTYMPGFGVVNSGLFAPNTPNLLGGGPSAFGFGSPGLMNPVAGGIRMPGMGVIAGFGPGRPVGAPGTSSVVSLSPGAPLQMTTAGIYLPGSGTFLPNFGMTNPALTSQGFGGLATGSAAVTSGAVTLSPGLGVQAGLPGSFGPVPGLGGVPGFTGISGFGAQPGFGVQPGLGGVPTGRR